MEKEKKKRAKKQAEPNHVEKQAEPTYGYAKKTASNGLVIKFPFRDLPVERTPRHPRDLRLSLSADRRRKLHAIYGGLKARGATISHGRGGEVVKKPVYELSHAILWILDNAELLVE